MPILVWERTWQPQGKAVSSTTDGDPPCPIFVQLRWTRPRQITEPSSTIACVVRTETHGQTGVEMEALTGVQVALLTIYDMCKAVDRGMVMGNVKLLEKHGGKSGDWVAGSV